MLPGPWPGSGTHQSLLAGDVVKQTKIIKEFLLNFLYYNIKNTCTICVGVQGASQYWLNDFFFILFSI